MSVNTYKGNTFKNLMRQYSYDRMGRDRTYRKEVLEIIAQRKEAAQKTVAEEKKQ